MTNIKKHGGSRVGAGRKSRAEELGLPMLMNEVMTEDKWLKLFEVAYNKAKDGSIKHLELLMNYKFGKPNQTVDIHSTGEPLFQIPIVSFGNKS